MESRRVKWAIAIAAICVSAVVLSLGLGTWRALATLDSSPETDRDSSTPSGPMPALRSDRSEASALHETISEDDRVARAVDPPPQPFATPPVPRDQGQGDAPASAKDAGPSRAELGDPGASSGPDGGTEARRCTRRLEKLGDYPGFKVPVRINGVPLVFAWHPDEPLDTSFIEPEAVMRLGLTRQVMSGTIAHARPLRVKPDLVEPFSARVEQVEIDGRSTGPVWLGVAQFALVFLGADGQLGRDLIEGLGLALTREGQLRYLNCEGP